MWKILQASGNNFTFITFWSTNKKNFGLIVAIQTWGYKNYRFP